MSPCCCLWSPGTLADLLGIVESVLYAKRLPDAIFNLAFNRATNDWPRQTAAVTTAIKANARWTQQQDEQVRLCVCEAGADTRAPWTPSLTEGSLCRLHALMHFMYLASIVQAPLPYYS